MEVTSAIKGEKTYKKFKKFELNIPELKIPQGYATALIGENGAGKTTLLNILSGIRMDYKGNLLYFDKYTDKDREFNPEVKDKIGYTGPGKYYLPQWTIGDVEQISKLLFPSFSSEKFNQLCTELALSINGENRKKKNSNLSDGNKMKLMLSGVFARDTDILLLDEPASPLDPLMRDKLCQMISEYIEEGNGQKSVFFSTHNISDMENITDYAIIMEHGTVVEEGFVEDLKEKYILVKGEREDADKAKDILYTVSTNSYGFEGVCLAEDLDKLAGMDVVEETPSLYQISVAVMKKNTKLVMR